MDTNFSAEKLNELTDVNLVSVKSELFDELMSECIKTSHQGEYRLTKRIDNNYSGDDVDLAFRKLTSLGFDVSVYEGEGLKKNVKWYSLRRYELATVIHISWDSTLINW